MSEKGPRTDSAPEKDPHYIEGVPEALQIEEINKLRGQQWIAESKAAIESPFDNPEKQKENVSAVRATFDKMIEDHLATYGIDKDTDPKKFDEYKALLRSYSVDKIPNHEWENGPVGDDGTSLPSERAKAAIKLHKEFAPESPELEKEGEKEDDEPKPTDTKEEDKTEETKTDEEKDDEAEKAAKRLERIAELEKELEGVQGAKQAAFAARMAVGFFASKDRKELQSKYEEAEKVYLEKLKQLELLKLEKLASEPTGLVGTDRAFKDDLERNITEHLKEDDAKQREIMIEEGGWKAKLLEKYANMSTKKKIALGLAAGGLLAASGFGAALLGGIGGGLLASAAAGGVAGGRFARTHAILLSRMYASKDPSRLEFKLEDDDSINSHEALERGLNKLHEESKKDIESADRIKKRAVLFSVGAVALGSATAITADAFSEHGPSLWGGRVHDYFATPDTPAAPEAWKVDVAPVTATTPEMHFTPEMFNLNAGEGGYNLLQRMNIPQEHWHDLWQNVGPDLQNVTMDNGTPFSYQMPNGEWGIRMTADGKVPEAALEAIAKTHENMFGSMPSGVSVTEAAPQSSASVEHTPMSQGDAEALKDVVASNPEITAADIQAHPELFDKLGTVQPGLSVHEYTVNTLGIPETVWVNDVEPFIMEQLGGEFPNPNFEAVFGYSPDAGVTFKGNKVDPDVLARILESVPWAVRSKIEFDLAA